MDWDAVGAIGELVGAAAVVASLAYLAVQIRQNTRSMQAASYDSIVSAGRDLSFQINRDSELGRIYGMGLASPDRLSPADRARFSGVMEAYFRLVENIFHQGLRGTIDEEMIAGWLNYAMQTVSLPGGVAWWEANHQHFSPRFRQWVETQRST